MPAETEARVGGYRVRPRPDWDAVFHRTEGWTGSDNSYSIPLPGEGEGAMTLFVFGDSFIGAIDPETGRRAPDSVMVNNAAGLLHGRQPDPAALELLLGPPRGGHPASSLVVPALLGAADAASRPAAASPPSPIVAIGDAEYYWLQDGLALDGALLLFASRVTSDPEGPEGFRFAVLGTDLLRVPLSDDGRPRFAAAEAIPVPHDQRGPGLSRCFGAGVLDEPDSEWIYVYGLEKRDSTGLLVARVARDKLLDFAQWRFLGADGWRASLDEAIVPVEAVSSELAVTRLSFGPDVGRYALIYSRDGIEPYVEMRLAETPWGPFGPAQTIWHCPEPAEGRGIYAYNAKAHPELSAAGRLLISYNVNTRCDAEHMADGHIYRIRWIELSAAE